MHYRTLGKTGWKVSEISHGMWGIGSWTGSSDKEALAALYRSVELGINFFDTAWIYGNGHSEQLLGKLLKSFPDKKLYTSTKIPPKSIRYPMEPYYKLSEEYPPDHMEKYIHKSIKNLGLERLDLVLLHGWDDAWANDKMWQDEVRKLKEKGLISAFGISIDRWEPENAVRVIQTGLIDVVQVIYNIFDQAPEDQLFPVCRKFNVGVMARVPFDEGTLTGTINSESRWPEGDWRNKYFNPENLKASLKHLDKLKADLPPGMTLPELALRFILSNPDVSTTNPGMRKVRNVEENVNSCLKGKLDPGLVKILGRHRWDRKPAPSAG